ncbi:MAG TPA: GTP-binding protein, partial [Spirochaetota bacterium]|nr:GTP-binding protein [Spirochaetota bacterium]
MKKIKNIAIIAHVDHGKTTLVDGMLRQSGIFRSNQHIEERVMDSNDLERERGITIFSKNASIHYKDFKINIVDTPGHADFGGEVQRIMKMVDCVLLIVDAFEGPMPQTKYVLKKSLELGLSPIVVINKIDRPNSRPHEVLDMIFDLFVELNATNEQLDFPVVYASAKQGIAKFEVEDPDVDLKPLFETIIKNVKEPEGEIDIPLQFLVSAIDYDNYLGRIGTGKIHNGQITAGDTVTLMK